MTQDYDGPQWIPGSPVRMMPSGEARLHEERALRLMYELRALPPKRPREDFEELLRMIQKPAKGDDSVEWTT